MLLTFDLDGVLMKNPFSTGVFPEVTRRLGTVSGLSHKEIMARILDEARERVGKRDIVGAYDWDGIISLVAGELGYSERIDVAELVRSYCTKEHIYYYPGVPETLDILSKQGHTLVALTNGYKKYQLPVLEGLSIARFFTEICTPEVCGFAKPEVGLFLEPRKRYGKPHVHIGDTVIHDVWGANQAGCITIWVNHSLPQEIWDLSIEERTVHPRLPSLVQEGIARDLNPGAYPEVTVEGSMPHYVIREIEELVDIISLQGEISI